LSPEFTEPCIVSGVLAFDALGAREAIALIEQAMGSFHYGV
jgi:hypothetical protein